MSADNRLFNFLKALPWGGRAASELPAYYAQAAEAFIAATPRGDWRPSVVASVVRSICRYRANRAKGHTESNWLLWEHTHAPVKAEAIRLARLPNAKGRVDREALHRFVVDLVTAYRALPGNNREDDDHQGVINRRVRWFGRMILGKKMRRPDDVRRPAADRKARAVLRSDVYIEDAMHRREGARGFESRVVVMHGRRHSHRRLSGRLSASQMYAVVATERSHAFYRQIRQEEEAWARQQPAPQRPDWWGVKVMPSTVAAMVSRVRGMSGRQAVLEAQVKRNVRELGQFLTTILPQKAYVWVDVDDLAAKMWAPSPGLKSKHRQWLKAALEGLMEARVGIHYRIVGTRVYLRACARSIPAEPLAGRKFVRRLKLGPHLAPSRRDFAGSQAGELAETVLHALAGTGRMIRRSYGSGSGEDVFVDGERLLSMMGYSPKAMNAFCLASGCDLGDGIERWRFMMAQSEHFDLTHELFQPMADLAQAYRNGGFAAAWRHLCALPYLQGVMAGEVEDMSMSWQEAERIDLLLEAMTRDLPPLCEADPSYETKIIAHDKSVTEKAREFSDLSRSGVSRLLTRSERRIRMRVGGARRLVRPVWTRPQPPPEASVEPLKVAIGQSHGLPAATGGRVATPVVPSFADVEDDGHAF